MRISDVRHQGRAGRILQRALHVRRVPHAYVFHGPPGIGKEMLATRFARVLLCDQAGPADDLDIGDDLDFAPIDACGRCESCLLVHADTHPDLHRIHRQLAGYHPDAAVRARKALNLSVDVIRHFLIEKAGTKPMQGRAKVFILREAERLTNAAQNALLKTLEEPPPQTFIILLATALDRLLPTTQSRSQTVPFSPLPTEFVSEQLRGQHPDLADETARFLAHFCDGQLGTALQQAADEVFETKRQWGRRLAELDRSRTGELAKQFQDDAKDLAKKHRQREPDATEAVATRTALQTLIATNATFFRDVLHAHAGRHDHLINQDQREVVTLLTDRLDSERAIQALEELRLAETRLGQNANPTLTIETLFTCLARLG